MSVEQTVRKLGWVLENNFWGSGTKYRAVCPGDMTLFLILFAILIVAFIGGIPEQSKSGREAHPPSRHLLACLSRAIPPALGPLENYLLY